MSKNGKRKITLKDRKCEGCGVTFTPASGRQRFHSAECRREHANGAAPRAKTPDLLGVLAARTAAELEAAASDLERIEARREAALERLRNAKQVGNILLEA